MSVLSISQHHSVSAYERLYGTSSIPDSIQRSAMKPEIEPIFPIAGAVKQVIDVNDIDMDRVRKYEEDIFGLKSKEKTEEDTKSKKTDTTKKGKQAANSDVTKSTSSKELDEDDQKKVDELKRIDTEVRQHEAAHLAAAGGLAQGGPSFTYTQGPDGNQYATGGEVNVSMDTDPNNPDATIRNMQIVIASAMAPADPSGQDFSVAASARQIIAEMQQVKAQQTTEENQAGGDKSTATQSTGSTKSNSTINNQLDTYRKYNSPNFYSQKGTITNFVA